MQNLGNLQEQLQAVHRIRLTKFIGRSTRVMARTVGGVANRVTHHSGVFTKAGNVTSVISMVMSKPGVIRSSSTKRRTNRRKPVRRNQARIRNANRTRNRDTEYLQSNRTSRQRILIWKCFQCLAFRLCQIVLIILLMTRTICSQLVILMMRSNVAIMTML